ncbi:condensation domain-containing protein, partial [Nocardia araoensis]|uniref:condensation domain-containing protein n=1 Tax=Nocardia araoensis TaxID=228600 RepID=UPI001FE0C121
RVLGGQAGGVVPELVAGPRPERVPLSLAQQRLWFLNRYDPQSAAYNMPWALRLTGVLDVSALSAALVDVVERHEALRTRYPEHDGVAYQQILPTAQVIDGVAVVDVDRDRLSEAVTAFGATGFDVTTDALVRVGLFAVTPVEHVLVLVVHHINADGFSMAPFARDVMSAYRARLHGQAPSWTALPVQPADFALWQRAVLGTESDPESLLARQTRYWQSVLSELPEESALPLDRPRPSVASHRGDSVGFELDPVLVERIEQLGRAHQASVLMVWHAALAVVLTRLSADLGNDIAVGTPVAGRGHSDLDNVVGMFVNTLVLRAEVHDSESVTELLTRIRRGDLDAFAHADVPFERIVELLNPERSGARHPLFQVMLAFQDLGEIELGLDGLEVSPFPAPVSTIKFDLEFTVVPRPAAQGGDVALTIGYATDLFDTRTVHEIGTRLLRVLEAFVTDPRTRIGQ